MKATRVAWALAIFTALCSLATAVLYLSGHVNPLTDAAAVDGFPVTPIGVLLAGILGALVVSRYPGHRVGWLLCVGQAGSALGLTADAYAHRMHSPPALAVAHLFDAGYALAFTCAVFLLVPDGRLLSRRWRPVLALLPVAYLLGLVPVDALRAASVLTMTVALVAAVVALVLRLRRASGPLRRQLRWIMAGAVLLAAAVVLFAVGATVLPSRPSYVEYGLYLGFAAVPVCTGIAILRYRLYDIDVIINRAVVLAILAMFVTTGYVALVVGVGDAVGTGLDRRVWPSLAALVVVALAFQPLRQRVLRLADRLVYGQRAAPYEALSDFSRRLGSSLTPEELLPAMAEAVVRGVGAAAARVSLELPSRSASWPQTIDRAPDVDVQIRDRFGVLGRIALVMPPGRALRLAERRLLEAFCAQAALALRNLRLDAELRVQVERMGRQTAALESSRRRLLAARDDERRRTAGVIDREVIRYLRPIPEAVERLDPAGVVAAGPTLQRLEQATEAALDALRVVTHGVYPAMLTRRGLVPALRGHATRTGRAGVLTIGPGLSDARLGEQTESAAYFCAVALLPAASTLALSIVDGSLLVRACVAPGLDDTVMDRVETAGGRVSWRADTLLIELPVQPPDIASAHMAASRSVPNEDLAR